MPSFKVPPGAVRARMNRARRMFGPLVTPPRASSQRLDAEDVREHIRASTPVWTQEEGQRQLNDLIARAERLSGQ